MTKNVKTNKDPGFTYYVSKYRYTAVLNPNATYTKGTTQYSDVTSDSADTYPEDGYKDGYYYIKTNPQ